MHIVIVYIFDNISLIVRVSYPVLFYFNLILFAIFYQEVKPVDALVQLRAKEPGI